MLKQSATEPKSREGRNLRVLLVAPSPPPYGGMAIQAKMLERRLLADGLRVTFFPSNLVFPEWLSAVNRVPGLRTLVRTFLVCTRLWGAVRAADVVHILAASWVYFFAVVCPAVLYGRWHKRRVVLNYRGGDAREFFRIWGWLIRPLFHLANAVTTPSEFLAAAIRTRFGVGVTVVPNILEDGVFRYRQRDVVRPKLLITRHLEPIYGVETALQAFRLVQERHPDASLWIAGTGSQEQALRDAAAEWKLRNVRFLGYVSHSELGALYDECDILLNASRVDNFPGALLEASGAGLVIVSTGAGGIPFMFRNGHSALLVEIGDAAALAGAVEVVLRSPSLAADLVRNARAVARQCHWTEVRKAIYESYGVPSGQANRAEA